jgi:hypothetical protein
MSRRLDNDAGNVKRDRHPPPSHESDVIRRYGALLREAIPWLDHEPDEGRDLARRIEAVLDDADAGVDHGD